MTIIDVKKPKESNERLKGLKNKMLNSNCVKFSFNLPRHVHVKFKMRAIEKGEEMTEAMRDMILNYIDK
jgi:hypothetical protein